MMTRKRVNAVILVALLAATTPGCQSSGSTATSQPSLPTIALQATASMSAAVNAIRVGVDLKLIDNATYWRDIDPFISAGQAATQKLRDAANAGDVDAATAAEDALAAVLAKLRPYLQTVADAAAKKAS